MDASHKFRYNERQHFAAPATSLIPDTLVSRLVPNVHESSIVLREGSRRHFAGDGQAAEEPFRPICRQVEHRDETEEGVRALAKKRVESKNQGLSEEQARAERRHLVLAAERTSATALLPSVRWKTKRVVLDERGFSRKTDASREHDLVALMTRKRSACCPERTQTLRGAECSSGFFRQSGGAVREQDLEESAERLYRHKLAVDETRRAARLAAVDLALVLGLSNATVESGQALQSWEQRTGNFVCKPKAAS